VNSCNDRVDTRRNHLQIGCCVDATWGARPPWPARRVRGKLAACSTAAPCESSPKARVVGRRCSWSRSFTIVQGQRCVLAVLIPAFAVRHRHSMLVETPLLFGLPLPTKWLIPLQLLGALASFAALRDVGGLAGILAATAWGARLPRKRR
jgi:hypothetical protein